MRNWVDRSVDYLSRNYDSARKGQDYSVIKSTIHIGILDHTLFPDYPEFYAEHKIMNTKNYHVFSNKFMLNVLDLSQIELATEEDKQWQLDRWANLFKEKTWEGLRMLAQKDEVLREAAHSLYSINQDRNTMERIRRHEEWELYMQQIERERDEQSEKLKVQNQKVEELEQQLQEKIDYIKQLEKQLKK